MPEFADRYMQSKTGNVPYKQFPELLQKVTIVKVPNMKH
jgi:predicted metal-binding protein